MKGYATFWTVFLSALLAASVLLVGCDSDDPADETGTVEGVITAADGVTPIQGATVGLATDDAATATTSDAAPRSLNTVLSPVFALQMDGPTTTTNADGEFTLEGVPEGEQTLAAKRGAFEATFTVNVTPGDVVATDPIGIESVQPLGYVPGAFDSIEDVVQDLGNDDIEEISLDDLSDPDVLSEYAIIFINCGASSYSEERAEALEQYVNQGGTLYVSDLEAPYIDTLFPDEIDFSSNSSPETLDAEVLSSSLEDWLQENELSITYDAGGWERIVDLEGDAEVLLRGQPLQLDEGDEPLAITFNLGSGRVVYTTFHNTAGVPSEQEGVLRYYIYLDV